MAVIRSKRVHANGNVQTIGELGHLPGASIGPEVLENHQPIPADPQSEAVIALQQLGYKPAEASKMAKDAFEAGDTAEAVIRKALKAALRS